MYLRKTHFSIKKNTQIESEEIEKYIAGTWKEKQKKLFLYQMK